MRVQSAVSWVVVVGALASWSPRVAVGQQFALGARTPRFLYASTTDAKPVEIDVSRDAVLGRVVSLQVEGATIGSLLVEIQRQTGLTFAYDHQFPATQPVTLEAASITVAAALGAILVGTGADVVLTPTGHVWLTKTRPPTFPAQEGKIAGRVTDRRTDDPIVGATVTLDPVRQSVTTGTDGRYRFANLSPGNYTVQARYIGYRALAVAVTVGAGPDVTVDLPLQKTPHQLEEVVTTGTVVPTEVKALPTPVSVITAIDIEKQRPSNMQQLVRQAVPGAIGWDQPANPFYTAFSVRGASTLNPGVGQMKVFVDGIEAANLTDASVDPNSVERVEVIRGPQAAAIYGSDAISGVIQIFTKRGDPALARPQVDVQASAGVVQTPYVGVGRVLRQSYAASVRGGSSLVSYNLGGGYAHTDDWLPGGEISRQSNPSYYGGVRFTQGLLTVDVSGRFFVQNSPSVFNPDLAQSGAPAFLKPNYQPFQVSNQTMGMRITLAPTNWWHHTLTAGTDRLTFEVGQTEPRLRAPSDTLLRVQDFTYRKNSIAYNTSLQGFLTPGLSASLTAGFDHYGFPATSWFTLGALNTTGTIRLAPGQAVSVSRSITNNTGYFAQVQFGLHDALFFTAGLRAEQNSEFGDSLGLPLSPRAGLSYVRQLRQVTIKLRGSWGRTIRAPAPGLKVAVAGPSGEVLANSGLGPEHQQGWDAGMDLAIGSRASLGVTYYDQIAKNLIQQVFLQSTPVPISQNQNVGRVKNRGVEVESRLTLGAVELKGQYGFARSRIEGLAPNYTGDLRVGDQSLVTPKHSAGVWLTVAPIAGTTVSMAMTYVGSWNQIDFLALNRCSGGTGSCRATRRDYTTAYPGFVKFNATIWQQLTPVLSTFASVDNVTNKHVFEQTNSTPITGRTTMIGLRLQY